MLGVRALLLGGSVSRRNTDRRGVFGSFDFRACSELELFEVLAFGHGGQSWLSQLKRSGIIHIGVSALPSDMLLYAHNERSIKDFSFFEQIGQMLNCTPPTSLSTTAADCC